MCAYDQKIHPRISASFELFFKLFFFVFSANPEEEGAGYVAQLPLGIIGRAKAFTLIDIFVLHLINLLREI